MSRTTRLRLSTAIIDSAQTAVEDIKNDPSLITDPNNPSIKQANRLANDYGSTQCGS